MNDPDFEEAVIATETETSAAHVEEADRRFVFHPFTQLGEHEQSGTPGMIVEGKGARVSDVHGRSYIDGMAGLWCVNVGYGREELGEAMRAAASKLGYYHSFSSMSTDTPALLAERLIAMAPAGDVEGLLRLHRLRRERHPGQDRLVLQQRPRPAREEEDHRPATAATTGSP